MPTLYLWITFSWRPFHIAHKGLFALWSKKCPRETPHCHILEEYAWLNSTFWGAKTLRFLSGRDPLYSVPPEYRKKSCLQINLRWQNSLLLALVWCVVMNGLVLEFNGLYWYVKWTVFPPITLCACVRTARYRLSRRLPVTKDGHKFLTLLKHQWIEHRYSVIESIQPIFSPKHNLRSLILSYEITTI